MVEIRLVDTENKKQVNEFVQFPFDLYKGDKYWVPPFRGDIAMEMNKKKHPFYEHSEADFFTAWQDGKMVGRIAALNNRRYNDYHHETNASIFLFDSIDNQEVANALFGRAADWAHERKLNGLIGPKGFSVFDGYGMLAEGFDQRQMVNFCAYNYPYYVKLYETFGFKQINQYTSMTFTVSEFHLPEKVRKVAEIAQKRGTLKVFSYKSRKEIVKHGLDIAHMYATSFENNWEFYPMTDREFDFFVKNTISLIDPKLVKFIANQKDELVGILVNIPDISAAMQRHNGRITPALLIDILHETKVTTNAALNGLGILDQYHGQGGNALLYCAMEDVFKANPQYKTCEAVQMADSAKEVQLEMKTLGLKPNKVHRVYKADI